MSAFKKLSRREFLSLTGKTAGAFIVATSFSSGGVNSALARSKAKDHDLGVFVCILANGEVEIICHRAEMGQGIITSVPQLIAEEMGADWDRVTAVLGKADVRYGNQSTGGSASIRREIKHIRQMGAIARDMLEQSAADRWSVNKDSVSAENHRVVHKQTGRGPI